MTTYNDPDDPRRPYTNVEVHDEKARKAAGIATIVAALAGILAIVGFIIALAHNHDGEFAPSNCDPATDYVCEPETQTQTTTVDVPTTTMSPSSTEVPVPTSTPSEIVTTTVVP